MLGRREALGQIGIGAATIGLPFRPAAATRAVHADADTVLLLSYFTDADEGRQGLKLAWSEDGLRYEPLGGGRGYLTPVVGKDRLMRDPCITQGPDGVWHMVWTSDWFGSVIGHASSPDLRNWSVQQSIPVMAAFPGTRNSWAPEAIWDARARHWVIMWSSSIAGRYGATAESGFDGLDHRPYFTTTRDFRTFAPTRLLFDPGFSAIDFTWLRLSEGGVRLIYKDETHGAVNKRWLVTSTAAAPTGPFGPASAPFTQSMTEGPTAIRLGDRYIVYYDVYEQHHFGAKTTTDFATWTDVTPQIQFPPNARHGTVVRVPRRTIEQLA